MGKVAIKSLVLGALLIVLLECYYVITTPGTTIYAASVDVLLSIAVMLIVALLFISELKGVQAQAEAGAKELASSEEKYRRLLGDINDGYCVIQGEKYVIANQTYADALRVSIDQIVGTSLGQGSASESPALRFVLDRYRKRIKGELPPAERYEVSARDGKIFEVSSKLIDYEGRPAVSAVVRDITERKWAEQTFLQQNEFLNSVLESLSHPFYVIDVNDYSIKMANSAAKIGNLSENPSCYGLTHGRSEPCDHKIHPCPLEEMKRTRKPLTVEHVHYDKDGNARCVEIHAYPLLDGDGNVAQVIAYTLDITQRKRAEDALRQSEEKYRRLLGDINDGYCVIQDEKVIVANEKYAEITGIPFDQIIGYPLGAELPADARERLRERHRRRISGEAEAERYEGVNETGRWVEVNTKLIEYEGRPAVAAVVRDISIRKRMEEQLRESERLYSTMAHSSQTGVYIIQDGKFVLVNPQFLKDTGYAEDELLGKDSLALVHPEDREMVRENAVKMLKGERSSSYEYRFISEAGETKWIMETVASIQYQGKRATLGNFMDITQRKQMEEIIRHMAYHDALTRLPNRRLFDDRLDVELAHARRNQEELAVLFLDLDGFKEINDTLGHKMGDLLLQAVGGRLTSLLRKSDTVARMGGDEFALILPEMAQAEDADKVAQKILEAFREPFALHGAEVCVSVSIGIAVYPGNGKDADALLSNADTAMYCAKEQGGDRYLRYTPAMGAGTLEGTTTSDLELLPVSGDTQDEG